MGIIAPGSTIEVPIEMRIAALKKKIAILSQEIVNTSAVFTYKAGGQITITKEDLKAIHNKQIERRLDPKTGDISYSFIEKEEEKEEESKNIIESK